MSLNGFQNNPPQNEVYSNDSFSLSWFAGSLCVRPACFRSDEQRRLCRQSAHQGPLRLSQIHRQPIQLALHASIPRPAPMAYRWKCFAGLPFKYLRIPRRKRPNDAVHPRRAELYSESLVEVKHPYEPPHSRIRSTAKYKNHLSCH